jgi:hypothetical protein
MADRARDVGNLLLREGSLRKEDDGHRAIYAELMGDSVLFEEVRLRLQAVGWELIQELGHLGVRVAGDVQEGGPMRNHMGLDARHVRVLAYLWVHLVYREWLDLRRDRRSAHGDAGQLRLDDAEDERRWHPWRTVFGDFDRTMSKPQLTGVLGTLKRQRFIGFDERADRIWADASLYVLVDRNRMEDFVIDLARRLAVEDPVEAVVTVATGSLAPSTEETL